MSTEKKKFTTEEIQAILKKWEKKLLDQQPGEETYYLDWIEEGDKK